MQSAMGSAPGAQMLPFGGTLADLDESFVGPFMGRAGRSLIRSHAEDLHFFQAIF